MISISYHTPTKPDCPSFGGLAGLPDNELDEIARQLRSATAAISAELSNRHGTKEAKADKYCDDLLEKANIIKSEGSTSDQKGSIREFLAYITDPSLVHRNIKRGKRFLWLVSSTTGWSYAILLFHVLGKRKIQRLCEAERVKLVEYVAQNRDLLYCPTLDDSEACYRLDRIEKPSFMGYTKRKHNHNDKGDANPTPTIAAPGNHIEGRGLDFVGQKRVPAKRAMVLNDILNAPMQPSPRDPSPGSSLSSPVSSKREHGWVVNSFLRVVSSLGGSNVCARILNHSLSPQKRWDYHGNVCCVTMHDAGLDDQVTRLFSDKTRLEQVVEDCIQRDLVVMHGKLDSSVTYSLSDQVRNCVSKSFGENELSMLGLIFTAHLYPRDPGLDYGVFRFRDLGNLLLPNMERTWQYLETKPSLPASTRENLVEACLAVCKLGTASCTNQAISVLTKMDLTGLPEHLRMAIVHRQSISLRSQGDHNRSEVAIQELLQQIDIASMDHRSHCAYGHLLLSRTENAILRKDFTKAVSLLDRWEARSGSPLEFQVIRMKQTVFGRVSRYRGNFKDAQDCLEACLQTTPKDASRFHVMYHLADVYCESRRPINAENLVLPEVNVLRASGRKSSKPFRRLAMPLAEAYIEQRKLGAALNILRELLEIFDRMDRHDVPDQLGHVRVLIGLARLCWYEIRYSETYQMLERALVLTTKYRTFSEGNFHIGVIHLFLAAVHSRTYQHSEFTESLASATNILEGQVPRYFMPGMGSYFLEELHREIPGSAL